MKATELINNPVGTFSIKQNPVGQKCNHAIFSKDQRTVRRAVDLMIKAGKSQKWISDNMPDKIAYFQGLDRDFVTREIENYLR